MLHFGLAPDETLARLEVVWSSGIVQRDGWPGTNVRDDLVETGLRAVDHGLPGIVTTLACVGPAGATASPRLGLDAAHVPLPGHGGVLEILPLLTGPLPVPRPPAPARRAPAPDRLVG